MSYITFENVVKEYRSGENAVLAVDDVSFGIERGELCVVLGPSGAGKTTVLNLLGGMERVTSGCIRAGGREVTSFGERELTAYRREDVGFVFQFYNLMPNLTALENVELAKQICKNPLDPVEVLEQVGLLDRMNNFPAQLSGGEQQRVSIARALCKNPTLLLCDEPTGALDSRTGMQVLRLLSDVSAKYGTTVIIIT
ncbi:MAG: ABC transporter ATP-binding protein, partial [Acetivibrionales bacterium]